MGEVKLKKIALNCAKKPNRGLAYINDLEKYDNLTHEPWLEKMVDDIRNGNDALKDELPIRCSHYYRFNDNHRRQADMDPEAFLFQTCVDIDDLEAVEPAITRAYLINDEEGGKWQNHLLHMEYSARKKLHIDKWLEEKRVEALKNADESMDELRKRSAVIAFRCAVVFHLLSGCERESRACIDFMLMMADYVLDNQMHLLCEKMESQQAKNAPAVVKTIHNKTVYDKLPNEFTLYDVKMAKGLGLEESSYRSIVCKWKASGFIKEQPADPTSADRKAHYVKLSA